MIPKPSGLLSKLEVVGVDLESESELCQAMGNSQAVVCALGASESEAFNVKGPYQVSRQTRGLVVSVDVNVGVSDG